MSRQFLDEKDNIFIKELTVLSSLHWRQVQRPDAFG